MITLRLNRTLSRAVHGAGTYSSVLALHHHRGLFFSLFVDMFIYIFLKAIVFYLPMLFNPHNKLTQLQRSILLADGVSGHAASRRQAEPSLPVSN